LYGIFISAGRLFYNDNIDNNQEEKSSLNLEELDNFTSNERLFYNDNTSNSSYNQEEELDNEKKYLEQVAYNLDEIDKLWGKVATHPAFDGDEYYLSDTDKLEIKSYLEEITKHGNIIEELKPPSYMIKSNGELKELAKSHKKAAHYSIMAVNGNTEWYLASEQILKDVVKNTRPTLNKLKSEAKY
jgi:hypothetical protein